MIRVKRGDGRSKSRLAALARIRHEPMAKFTCTLPIDGKPALIGSVESNFGTDASPMSWEGNLKLLPYPVPTCNAPTVKALLGNLAREHGGTVESKLEGLWNGESDVIFD